VPCAPTPLVLTNSQHVSASLNVKYHKKKKDLDVSIPIINQKGKRSEFRAPVDFVALTNGVWLLAT
jgi:hypothetical protein